VNKGKVDRVVDWGGDGFDSISRGVCLYACGEV